MVVVQNPKYFKKLSEILKSAEPRAIANYLSWRAVKSIMDIMNRRAAEIREKYRKNVLGVNADPPRWKTCVKAVGFNSYSSESLRVAAGSMYIEKHFTPEAKEEMLVMIDYLKSAFKDIIGDITWMDGKTKDKAYQKLEKMRRFIAYPEALTDRTTVEDYYRDLTIDENDYFGNAVYGPNDELRIKANEYSRIHSDEAEQVEHRVHAQPPPRAGGQGRLAGPRVRAARQRILLQLKKCNDLSRGYFTGGHFKKLTT